ncbi:hypothetical protein VE02_00578 [Pseudogymnoascus sp. 03VT05]|nr:hypothetical protein VE02_00578 [Pseudogymnoascus sp. 03VT05]
MFFAQLLSLGLAISTVAQVVVPEASFYAGVQYAGDYITIDANNVCYDIPDILDFDPRSAKLTGGIICVLYRTNDCTGNALTTLYGNVQGLPGRVMGARCQPSPGTN